MTFTSGSKQPGLPTAPQGDVIATYSTYLEAQRAVDHLSDKNFAVQAVTIVGSELRMVERVTGRLTYPKVAAAGIASGAWMGLFVGTLLMLMGSNGTLGMIVAAVAVGCAFGLLFSVMSYSFTRGKRDFTSASQIVATTYSVLCLPQHANAARELLRTSKLGGNALVTPSLQNGGVEQSNGGQAPAPSQPHPDFVDPLGKPRYGVRIEDVKPVAESERVTAPEAGPPPSKDEPGQPGQIG